MKQRKMRLCALLLVGVILLLTGCQTPEEPDGPGGVWADVGTTAVETTIETVPADLAYELLRETVSYANGTAILRYPVFSEEALDGRGRAVNDAVRGCVDMQYRRVGLGSLDISSFEYEIETVTVTYVSERLVSYYATGYSAIEGASHRDTVAYTVNIDVQSGMAVETKDVLTSLAPLVDALETATLLHGDEDYLATVSAETLCAAYRDDYALYPSLAYTEDSVLVMIDVLYTYGGYALYEIPAESATSFLKEGSLPMAEFDRAGE